MLDPRQLAAMQARAAATLDIPGCVIQRVMVTADVWGAANASAPTTVATVACGLAKPSAQLTQQYAARLGNQQAWLARFAAGTDVREGDTLLVSGLTLTVQAVLTPRSYSLATQALVSAVR